METKDWWKSKTVWAGVVGVLIVVWNAVREMLAPGLPSIPEWVLALLASLGVYGRVAAKTAIK